MKLIEPITPNVAEFNPSTYRAVYPLGNLYLVGGVAHVGLVKCWISRTRQGLIYSSARHYVTAQKKGRSIFHLCSVSSCPTKPMLRAGPSLQCCAAVAVIASRCVIQALRSQYSLQLWPFDNFLFQK